MLERTPREWLASAAHGVFRAVFGLMIMQHGAQKLFAMFGREEPAELFSQIGLAGVLEFWGGMLIVVGLFTRPVGFLLSGTMAWAYFQVHAPRGWIPIENFGEMAVLYCFAFLYLAVHGGGRYSFDGWWAAKKKEPA